MESRFMGRVAGASVGVWSHRSGPENIKQHSRVYIGHNFLGRSLEDGLTLNQDTLQQTPQRTTCKPQDFAAHGRMYMQQV